MASSGSDLSEGESFELDFIVDSRKRGRNTEYLVRWKGYGEEEESWEPARNVRHSKEALEKFNQKEKTGDRKRVNESEEITTSSSVSGGRNVTKKTVVTKSETRTVTRRGGSQQVSEFSSPESSPVLSRRGFLSGDLLKQDASSSNRQQRSTITTTTTTSSSSSGGRQQLASGAGRSTFGRGILKPAPCDWPIIIMVSSYLFIALTFVIQQK